MNNANRIKKLNIMVDSKMELISIVEFLSGCLSEYVLTRFNFKYKQEIIKYFSKYKNHQCIRFYTDLCNHDFNFDAPVETVLHLSSLPELKIKIPFDDYLIERAGGKKNLIKFVNELSRFAKETNFLDFFDSNTKYYSFIENRLKEKMDNSHIVETLERYYGKRQASYNIILVSLFCGCFGPRIKTKNNEYDIFAIVGPTGIDSERNPVFDEKIIISICLHEFSHSFVNPLTQKFIKSLERFNALFEPISERMTKMAYDSWGKCVNEHIVRAVVGRIYFEKDKKGREAYLKNEKNKGFIYIKAIDKSLNEYEELKDRYPTFEDFYPNLIKLWENLYKMSLQKMRDRNRRKKRHKNAGH